MSENTTTNPAEAGKEQGAENTVPSFLQMMQKPEGDGATQSPFDPSAWTQSEYGMTPEQIRNRLFAEPQAPEPSWNNELAKKLNAVGNDPQAIQDWLKYQTLDPNSMSDEQLLRSYFSKQYGASNAEYIQEAINRLSIPKKPEFSGNQEDDPDGWDAYRRNLATWDNQQFDIQGRRLKAIGEARDMILSQKEKLTPVDPAVEQEKLAAANAERLKGVQEAVGRHLEQWAFEHNLSGADAENPILAKYSVSTLKDIGVEPEAIESFPNVLAQALMSNNVDPRNRDAVNQTTEFMFMGMFGKKIVESITGLQESSTWDRFREALKNPTDRKKGGDSTTDLNQNTGGAWRLR